MIRYSLIFLFFNLRQIYFMLNSDMRFKSPIWLNMSVFFISSNMRFLQVCFAILIMPVVSSYILWYLIKEREFRFKYLIKLPNRSKIDVINILKIIMCFSFTELGIRIYFILKKLVLRDKIPMDFKQIGFSIIFGSPLWFLKLVEEISVDLYRDIRRDLSDKKLMYRPLIRLWSFKLSIIIKLHDRIVVRYEILKNLRIFISSGKLRFNPNEIRSRSYFNRGFNIWESSIRTMTPKGFLVQHPLLDIYPESGMGYTVTHRPIPGQHGGYFKFSHDRNPNFIVSNEIQNKNIIKDRVVRSFQANNSEKILAIRVAEFRRWYINEKMHINGFDTRQIVHKGFAGISREELLKMKVPEKLVDQIMEERSKISDLEQFKLDFIEDFLNSNTYRDESGKTILKVEEMAKYNFNKEDDLYNTARAINIQMKAYSLWELDDDYLREFTDISAHERSLD